MCHFLTFNLNSWGVGSGGLLPPSSPVLTQTLGLGDKGAQGVLLEPVRVLEGEPLPILPLGEHKFHYIDFYFFPVSTGQQLKVTDGVQFKI